MNDAGASRAVAEESREASWRGASFLRDLFLGNYRPDMISSLPLTPSTREEFVELHDRLRAFLEQRVDPVEIDRTGEIPEDVIAGLAELGAFGLKIPTGYGGLGLSHVEYMQVMELVGSYDGNITALLSAHQSIGVPQPIKLFGTDAQKAELLPRCARGAISAFALTEPSVGSDPARLGTTARKSEDGTYFTLDGEKLWCTNGTLAELLVVMARDPDTQKINAFIVETKWPGVEVTHRCRFMGLRALANAVLRFEGVRIPAQNLIGKEGMGLKIALTTLNTGRLTLPAATTGTAKRCLEIVRKWSKVREQWGGPLGAHEAVAHMNARIAASAFAMESLALTAGALADRDDVDIRLEAAAAKEWNTVRGWELVDTCLQIRGGRGYETELSLVARGEAPLGVERALRDSRVNRIFEGSSEIMHLFMAREAVDKHLQVAEVLVDKKKTWADKLRALPKIAAFYLPWYAKQWLGWGAWPRWSSYGPLATHLRFAERASRRLARSIFHGMVVYQASLERKQAFLFRAVDIAMELFVLTAAVCRAHRLGQTRRPESGAAVELADLGALAARRRVQRLFADMWRNDDRERYRVGRALLDGRYRWLEAGTVPLSISAEDLRPRTFEPRGAAPSRRPPRPRRRPRASV